jgi:hypothetical protein
MTTRREFFRVVVGSAAALALPAVAFEPLEELTEQYGKSPAVDALPTIRALGIAKWYRRDVHFRIDTMTWMIYGQTRFDECDLDYCEMQHEEPDAVQLAAFDDRCKMAIARYAAKHRHG